MILCVTLNPCLDKTLVAPTWRPGTMVRCRSIREVCGGKGNNVARALRRLGRTARPVAFFGGDVGARCERLLRDDDGLVPLEIRTHAPTRVITTIRTEDTSLQTSFFDPDPSISETEAEMLFRAVEIELATGSIEALTLSGSSPSATTHGLYSELIGLSQTKRVPVFLDTYGPALEAIWAFRPDALQMNRREAAAHLKIESPSDADLVGLLERWSRRGVTRGVVTHGEKAALCLIDGVTYRATPPEVDVVNPVGSGDSLLAGLVDAHLEGLDAEATIRRSLACGVANALVWDAGAIEPRDVHLIEAEVHVERI